MTRTRLIFIIVLVSVLASLALLLPGVLEKAQPGNGIYGILYAAPVADLVSLGVILWLTVPFFKNMKK